MYRKYYNRRLILNNCDTKMSDESLYSEETITSKRTELDYEKFKTEIIQKLDENKTIVLATSSNDRVTSRTIWFGNDGLDIYFVSWKHNKKILQIKENSKVALTLGRIQFEGEAEFLGHPFDEKNKQYLDNFYKKIPKKSIDRVASVPEVVMVKITLSVIASITSVNQMYHLQKMDFEKKIVYQMRIDDGNHPDFPN